MSLKYEPALEPLHISVEWLFDLGTWEVRDVSNPKPETRNPKPETRNPKPETRNPKPETRNPKPETRNPKSEPPKLLQARPPGATQGPSNLNQKSFLEDFVNFWR